MMIIINVTRTAKAAAHPDSSEPQQQRVDDCNLGRCAIVSVAQSAEGYGDVEGKRDRVEQIP